MFAFVDPDISPEPFLVDRVEATATSALLDALAMWPGAGADVTLFVTDPQGEVFELAGFGSVYDETVWVEKAKDLAVEGGARAVAHHGHGRRFRRRYGFRS